MDYYDSAEDLIISRSRALQELRAHNCEDFREFFQDLGDKSEYLAQDVLIQRGKPVKQSLNKGQDNELFIPPQPQRHRRQQMVVQA